MNLRSISATIPSTVTRIGPAASLVEKVGSRTVRAAPFASRSWTSVFEPQAGTCDLRFGRLALPDGEPASRPRHPCDVSAAISRADRGAVRSGAAGGARAMGMLKLGTVALDGTKIHANASRHSALSDE